jgi:hypothetical protein
MDRRDVATITFKAIALWPIVTGLSQALEAAMTWDVAYAQLPAEVRAVTSSSDLLMTSVGAFLGRAALGVLLWIISGRLARLVFPEASLPVGLPDRQTLYVVGMFVIGVSILAPAIPTAAYWVYYAVHTGWRPRDAESGAQLAELVTRLFVGLTLLRGDWLLPSDVRAVDETAQDGSETGGQV